MQQAYTGDETALMRRVEALSFSPDGSLLAVAAGQVVTLFDVESRTVVRRLLGHQQDVMLSSFSPDGMSIATASWEGTVKFWSVADGTVQQSWPCFPSKVASVAFDPLSRYLVAGVGKQLIVWNLGDGTVRWRATNFTDRIVKAVATSPDGKTVLSGEGTLDETDSFGSPRTRLLKLWDLQSGNQITNGLATLLEHDDLITSVAFDPVGNRIAAGTTDGDVNIYETNAGRFDTHSFHAAVHVNQVAFDPTGRWLGIACGIEHLPQGYYLKLYDIVRKETRYEIPHPSRVRCLAFSSQGLVASGAWDGKVRLWHSASGKEAGFLAVGHTGNIPDDLLTPGLNGSVMTVGIGPEVVLWDSETGNPKHRLKLGHSIWTPALAATPDGSVLAAENDHAEVEVFDLKVGRKIFDFSCPKHGGDIISIGISEDGHRVAASWRLGIWLACLTNSQITKLTESDGVEYHDIVLNGDASALAASSAAKS